ncbi:MAG: carbohydrate binding family 9 domain-containing protein [Acidobacteria bacterium]|nr:carbohydrate binding family 9 domain-containing protein [Acidobacteriota bacterium]MBV9476677.1 carbohydrate binding family 9 domain-containing protein [Acidobacteriota bacterium]
MRRTLLFLLLVGTTNLHAEPAHIDLAKRSGGAITIDGDLADAGWAHATRIDSFVEYFRGDNTAPPVKTSGLLTYDDQAVYVAFRADDPRPREIRAPLVDRDQVREDQDYVAVMIDTANDRRAAVQFRVNPRGVQTDSVYNDTSGDEDFSPDFVYQAVARRTPEGWAAELRIPLSSLRYPSTDPQTWGVLLIRNYPRDFRYVMANTPIPRNSNCFVCHSAVASGIAGLPTGSHFTLTPYSTMREQGFDLKWNPSARLTFDATLNPDFSQIEADVPQLATDSSFAISYPEKRAFFLESVDLLATPLTAVYTRAITAPAWGMRATGQSGTNAYTLLLAEDRGGGSTILPGPYGSSEIPQEQSEVLVGRLRHTLGTSFVGLLATARENESGTYNRVLGPDFLWKPSKRDRVAGQLLLSDTDGARGNAARVYYTHDAPRWDAYAGARQYSPEFRADDGFLPQVGIRQTYVEVAGHLYPKKGITFLRTYLGVDYAHEYDGAARVHTQFFPGFFFQGKWGSEGWVTLRAHNQERVNGRMLTTQFVEFSLRAAPARWLPALRFEGAAGEKIDYAEGRTGTGANLSLSGTVRPTDHLQLQATASREWLDLDAGRLFDAQSAFVQATYTFSARSLMRVVAQQGTTTRNAALYAGDVVEHERKRVVSALYGYKLTFQTVFFVGVNDDSVFAKVAYAFNR